jgi:osmotically-inducible protein OsmY
MPTKKTTTTRRTTTTNATTPANGDAASLPAEPEVTRRSAAAVSNPGREPAHLAAARARRQQQQQSNREEAMRREYARTQRGQSCAPSSALASGLKLIGGAGLGAVLMYLMDPEAGERRREEMRVKAARAAATTGTVFGNVAEIAGNVAGNVWDMTTEAGRAAAHRAAEAGSAGAAAASSYGSSLADRARESAYAWNKSARRQMRSARKQASGWFGHEEERSYVPETSTVASAVTALAAGVGLMYLLDPTDGARRRSLLLDKTRHCLNETGDFFRRTGRHLANRSRGMAHDTQSMFQRGGEPADDRTVAERIRARLGHLQQPNADVNVAVVDGRATLTGRCSPDDVESLISTVQSTPGVASIVNLLTVETAGTSQSSTI